MRRLAYFFFGVVPISSVLVVALRCWPEYTGFWTGIACCACFHLGTMARKDKSVSMEGK